MLVIGLTGGIASGKTAASDQFAQLGVPVIDTDVISRQVVEPGTEGIRRITEIFGNTVILDNGQLDRKALRKEVFDSPHKRETLESILHPLIREESRRQIDLLSTPYCLWVVPLLVESKMVEDVDRVLVVDADEATQINRLMSRDKISRNDALKILQAQIAREERLKCADDIIKNESGLENIAKEVQTLHKKYLRCSQLSSE